MRRLSLSFLSAYIALTVYIHARSFFGLPYQAWTSVVLPLVALAFVLTHSAMRGGWRKTALLCSLTIAVTLLVESLGVTTGWIFGRYHYTAALGPLFLGLVPYVIPIAWLNMLYPSYLIADRIVPRRWTLGRRLWTVAALSGLAMTAWDLVMDPVMVNHGHWVWDQDGAWFGVPLQNFWGWWLTSFLVTALYLWLGGSHPTRRDDDRQGILLYAVMGLSMVVNGFQAGFYLAALAGLIVMGTLALWGWDGRRGLAERAGQGV